MFEQILKDYRQVRTMRHFLLELLLAWMVVLSVLTYGVNVPAEIKWAQQVELAFSWGLLGGLVFVRTMRTRWAAQWMIANMYAFFGYITWFCGGIYSPTLDWIELLPACTLLLGRRQTSWWIACSLAVTVFFAYAAYAGGHEFQNLAATYSAWGAGISISLLAVLVIHVLLYERLNDQAVNDLLNHKAVLTKAYEKLLRTQSHKDEFIAVVSHELRTPINAVMGFTSLMKDSLTDRLHPIIDHIQESARQLLSVITDILDYSQFQANKVELARSWMNPKTVLVDVMQRWQPQAYRKRLMIDLVMGANIPQHAFIDEYRIRQVLDHLVSNAIKFSELGVIRLKLYVQNTHLVFEVTDQGIGVTQDQLKQIFEYFQHASEEVQSRYGGTGLGLAICKSIAHLHGGEIYAQSQVGVGSTFTLDIPLLLTGAGVAHARVGRDGAEPRYPLTSSMPTPWPTKVKTYVQALLRDQTQVYTIIMISLCILMLEFAYYAPYLLATQINLTLAAAYGVFALALWQGVHVHRVSVGVQIVSSSAIFLLAISSGGISASSIIWFNMIPISPLYLEGHPQRKLWVIVPMLLIGVIAWMTHHMMLPVPIDVVPKGLGWALSGHVSMLGLLIFVPLLYKNLRKGSKDELLAKNSELEEIKNQLISQQRMKDHFIGTVSHALRTPMNAIIGFNDLLKEDIQDEPMMVKLQDMVAQSAQHLLTVINDILDYSQMELGHLKLKQETFDLPHTIQNAMEMFQASSEQAGLTLKLEMNQVPQWVQGDSQRLTQIMVNLLSNAIKFTTQGHVLVRLRGQDGLIRIDVEDTGMGIPQDRLLHIFEPFEQTGAHKLRRQGHGLGLSITKRLVEAQKGWITVSSELGRGTTFSFALDLALAQVTPAVATHPSHIHVNGESLTILIVDDQHLNRLLAIQVLQRAWPEARLLEAMNGAQAVDLVNQHPVDLILMDVLMPEMDGISATCHIRAHDSSKIAQVPILGLTANANEVTHHKCLQAGMNDIVFKPFQRVDLIKKIEALTQLSSV